MKTNTKQTKGFTLVELLVVIAIIATLAGIATPMILKARKAGDRTQAVSNAKQIGLALLDFDTEYGSFPDDTTSEDVQESTGSSYTMTGSYSNDYFRQLIAYGVQSEDIFYAKTSYTRKPDNVIQNTDALDAGEVGFGYIMKEQGVGLSTSGNPGIPVIVAPLIEDATDWRFDADPFDGKAVILKLDNSVSSPIIRTQGSGENKVSVGNGNNLEDTGDDTVWGSNSNPALMAPEPRG